MQTFKILLLSFLTTFAAISYAQKPRDLDSDDEIKSLVDEFPLFKGCARAAKKNEDMQCTSQKVAEYIQTNVNREVALASNGMCEINFVVEKNGSIKEVRIIKSVSPKLDEEISRVLRASTDWKPGEIQGHPVRTLVPIQLTFASSQETTTEFKFRNFTDILCQGYARSTIEKNDLTRFVSNLPDMSTLCSQKRKLESIELIYRAQDKKPKKAESSGKDIITNKMKRIMEDAETNSQIILKINFTVNKQSVTIEHILDVI